MPASSNSWAHLETLSHWQRYLQTKRVLTAVLTIFVGSVNTTTTTMMITSVGHFFFSFFSSFSFSTRQALVHPISNIISSSPCRQQRHNRYQFAHCCRVVHCTSSNRIMHMQLAHRTLSSRWPSSIEPLSCVLEVHLLTIIVVASDGVRARAIITD